MGGEAQRFDVIVLGVGGVGSAACWHLARRGRKVLGLERFDIPHTMGSSHGLTRIIRLAYHEHPGYVPLLRRAYENWRELQAIAGEQLLFITGSIDAGAENSSVFQGSLASCREHDLPHEVLSGSELGERFPAYRLPAEHRAVLQPEGGFVASERAIVAHTEAAQSAGATIKARERVLGWDATGDGVRVETDRGSYLARRLVVTAGAWVGEFVPELAPLARPERQVLAWLQPAEPALFRPDRFPVFNMLVDEGQYYGLPIWGRPGFKLGRYHHLEEEVDPDAMDRECHRDDEELLRACAAQHFPAGNGPTMGLTTCTFTNTPDGHFIIDTLPRCPQVIVASPCSGHGYKFCSALGEVLADLAETGRTRFDLSLFRLHRFGKPGAAGSGTGVIPPERARVGDGVGEHAAD